MSMQSKQSPNKTPRLTVTMASGGVIETAMLPYYLSRFLLTYDLDVRIALSSSAEKFVSSLALEALSHHPLYTENHDFNPYTGEAFHLSYSKTDCLFVFPASARILAQAALGIIDCPVTRLFAHFDKSKIIIVPWMHPDHDARIYLRHIHFLQELGCQVALESSGSLHWKNESGWLKGIALLQEQLSLSKSPCPSSQVWSHLTQAHKNHKEPPHKEPLKETPYVQID